MSPPIVYDDTSPTAHRIKRITNNVQSMIDSSSDVREILAPLPELPEQSLERVRLKGLRR
jgi:hypothetical protein